MEQLKTKRIQQTLRAKANVRKQSENHECTEMLRDGAVNIWENLRFYKVFATVELFTLAHEVSGNDKGLQGLLRAKILGNTRIYCNVAKGICKKESNMVKIKISYETLDEQEEVLRLLHPVTSSCKVAKRQNGAYKRAYVELGYRGALTNADLHIL